MIAETILTTLVRVNLVASIAILLVLAVRPFVLRRLGASVAYWLWLIVPIVSAASFVPAREQIVLIEPYASVVVAEDPVTPAVDSLPSQAGALIPVAPASIDLPTLTDVLVGLWLLGAATLLIRSIVSTRRVAIDPSAGPALIGVLRPKLVLPVDFETRFDAEERALILVHEDIHRASAHTVVNALVEVARCISWFNPLAHVAANRFRTDQELACDAAVIAARPTARRAYARALLKTQISPAFLPLGCTWTSRSGKRLGQRIALLGRPSLSRGGAIAGAVSVAVFGAALGYAAWAQQPERVVTQVNRPEAVWTPSAQAPAGTLAHATEGKRHDRAIDLAQKGNIDLVFFGTTTAEMWWWPHRGRSVWDREFGSLKAANFGSQGTHPESLVWRMRNGELDGYRAKLVVLSELGPKTGPGYAAVVTEIRARQPQAKILLLAAFPRGFETLPEWREKSVATAAAYSGLVDNETVFYDDFGERFYDSDGNYNATLWRGGASALFSPGFSAEDNGVGAQVPLFELWAEGLQPWLDRFVR
jgi:beta-lactamase regulating signal transducer with metallopeptidase domain